MRLEPLYRIRFTYPESWAVGLDGGWQQLFFIAEGHCEERLPEARPGRELPAAADRQRPPARLSRRPSDSRRRGGAIRMARIRAARRRWNARARWQRYPCPTSGTAG